MPGAMDTGQASGPSSTGNGDKDRYLQVLLQELCQLQAKYEFSRPRRAPNLIPRAACRGLSGWDGAKMPGNGGGE